MGRGRLHPVDAMAAKVQAASRDKGFKLVLCPKETALLYHHQQQQAPSGDDPIQVGGESLTVQTCESVLCTDCWRLWWCRWWGCRRSWRWPSWPSGKSSNRQEEAEQEKEKREEHKEAEEERRETKKSRLHPTTRAARWATATTMMSPTTTMTCWKVTVVPEEGARAYVELLPAMAGQNQWTHG